MAQSFLEFKTVLRLKKYTKIQQEREKINYTQKNHSKLQNIKKRKTSFIRE